MRSFIRGLFTALARLRGGAIDLTNARYEQQVAAINARDAAKRVDQQVIKGCSRQHALTRGLKRLVSGQW